MAIKPTVGRRVWFRLNGLRGTRMVEFDPQSPMDAGVCYVHTDTIVNLDVCDHGGQHHCFTSVPLINEGEQTPAQGMPYCEWMPYQVQQAKKES